MLFWGGFFRRGKNNRGKKERILFSLCKRDEGTKLREPKLREAKLIFLNAPWNLCEKIRTVVVLLPAIKPMGRKILAKMWDSPQPPLFAAYPKRGASYTPTEYFGKPNWSLFQQSFREAEHFDEIYLLQGDYAGSHLPIHYQVQRLILIS